MRDSGAMKVRQPSYSPPTGAHVRPRVSSGSAATALALLECDPETVLTGPLGGRNRRSAAALAREQYKEALERQAPADLLEFDSPAALSSAAVPDPMVTMPSVVAAAADAAAPATASSAAPSGPGSAAAGLWPGDAVLARYGPRDCFYRARIVRIYSRSGESLADVEWLRPQAGMPEDGLHLPSAGSNLDSTIHRHGLKVDTDLRSSQGGDFVHVSEGVAALPRVAVAPILPPPPGQSRSAPPADAVGGAGALHDLLDLQSTSNEAEDLLGVSSAPAAQSVAPAVSLAAGLAAPSGGMPAGAVAGMASLPAEASRMPALHPSIPGATGTLGATGAWGTMQPGVAFAGSGTDASVAFATSAGAFRGPEMMPLPVAGGLASPVAEPWRQVVEPMQSLASQQERFGFVSDMLSRAADAPTGVRQ